MVSLALGEGIAPSHVLDKTLTMNSVEEKMWSDEVKLFFLVYVIWEDTEYRPMLPFFVCPLMLSCCFLKKISSPLCPSFWNHVMVTPQSYFALEGIFISCGKGLEQEFRSK